MLDNAFVGGGLGSCVGQVLTESDCRKDRRDEVEAAYVLRCDVLCVCVRNCEWAGGGSNAAGGNSLSFLGKVILNYHSVRSSEHPTLSVSSEHYATVLLHLARNSVAEKS